MSLFDGNIITDEYLSENKFTLSCDTQLNTYWRKTQQSQVNSFISYEFKYFVGKHSSYPQGTLVIRTWKSFINPELLTTVKYENVFDVIDLESISHQYP